MMRRANGDRALKVYVVESDPMMWSARDLRAEPWLDGCGRLIEVTAEEAARLRSARGAALWADEFIDSKVRGAGRD